MFWRRAFLGCVGPLALLAGCRWSAPAAPVPGRVAAIPERVAPGPAAPVLVLPASRNRVATAGSLSEQFDPSSGAGVRFSVPLGTETYGGPVIAGELVLVGTNNERPRVAGESGDRGVLLALDRTTGALRWQTSHPKHERGADFDWPLQGLCGAPLWDGEALVYLSNRGELVRRTPAGLELWRRDLVRELGVHPRFMTASSPLRVGALVVAATSHGPAEDGSVARPDAPSLIAVELASGALVWQNAAPGGGLFEGQWASPTFARVGGRERVVYPAGDGLIYGIDAASGAVAIRFDANAYLGLPAPSAAAVAFLASAVVVGERLYIAAGRDPEAHASGPGHLFALALGPGPDAAPRVIWHFTHQRFGRSLSTVAVSGDRLYVADLNGFLFCLDAGSGALHFVHDLLAPVWSSPLVADGKVYLGDTDGDLVVLRDAAAALVLHQVNLGDGIYASPVAADGVLYVATRRTLFAFG